MIRAELEGDCIVVSADGDDAAIVMALPGTSRTRKMPPMTWHMPLNVESIALLRGVHVRASAELVAEAKRLLAVRRYVETQKRTGTAVPMLPMPVKAGTTLYNHQIKAYNIVLALFGYRTGGEGS